MTLANVVTLGRVCLIPLLVVVLLKVQYNDFNRYIGAGILLTIGFSDILDGYLARRRKEVSLLGKYLDPAADKLAVAALCLLLISSSWPGPHLPLWLVGIILGREAFILLGTTFLSLFLKQWQPRPDLFGKGNNVIQLVTFGIVIMGNVMPSPVIGFFLWMATISTMVSGLSYFWWGIVWASRGWKLERSI